MPDDIASQQQVASQPVPDYATQLMQTLVSGITPEAVRRLRGLRDFLGLKEEQVRAIHAHVFMVALTAIANDGWVDDQERERLHGVFSFLHRLGWAPGE